MPTIIINQGLSTATVFVTIARCREILYRAKSLMKLRQCAYSGQRIAKNN